jgi:hypothetical protein
MTLGFFAVVVCGTYYFEEMRNIFVARIFVLAQVI